MKNSFPRRGEKPFQTTFMYFSDYLFRELSQNTYMQNIFFRIPLKNATFSNYINVECSQICIEARIITATHIFSLHYL